ncbi:MAG: radical SAM family heme chaperone HemW [Sandaracinus sp.]|nr:radical SAM family heme chaperone HemW [Sandaracinus sp.]MCB9632815.1 radical SAM family heme chaperone HemW [Sandaracinus sp.]
MSLTSVYVHFPWCARKCPYCDFATRGVDPVSIPHEAYADAVIAELAMRADALAGRTLYSVFFGGGTPSLWSGEALGRVLAAIRSAFGAEVPDLEITAECNPSSLDDAKAQAFAAAGVNRLSLGVQSLNDERLRYLGRLHDRKGALRALAAARRAVPRVSGDLMFGMPDQTADALRDEVREMLDQGLDHVSAYALTIEPGTQFGTLLRLGKLRVAREDDYAAMFEVAERAFEDAGLVHYEVSNYARPGQEARHNLHYWRGEAYLGLGAAAVGMLDDAEGAARWTNRKDAERYMASIGEGRLDLEESERLDAQDRIREALMLGLRTSEGVDLRALEARVGLAWTTGRAREVERRMAAGDVVERDGRLFVPRERWLRLDGIVADLF